MTLTGFWSTLFVGSIGQVFGAGTAEGRVAEERSKHGITSGITVGIVAGLFRTARSAAVSIAGIAAVPP